MNYDLEHSDLATVLSAARLVADESKSTFGQLSADQTIPGFFGKLLIRTLRPDSGERSRRGRPFTRRPVTSPLGSRELHRTAGSAAASDGSDARARPQRHHDYIAGGSPTYNLMDAYRIIVVHEQNHFVQASRVMESRRTLLRRQPCEAT